MPISWTLRVGGILPFWPADIIPPALWGAGGLERFLCQPPSFPSGKGSPPTRPSPPTWARGSAGRWDVQDGPKRLQERKSEKAHGCP
eukprot:1818284-Pyramimonas_sp.AAC.1